MAAEKTTVARPYAEALFNRAVESKKLDQWSNALALLSTVASDDQVATINANPSVERARVADLVISVCGKGLTAEGKNLVKLLVENDRLDVMPEIADLYEALKNEAQGAIDALVIAPYAIKPAEQKMLAAALKKKLGREVRITSEVDPDLMGGAIIRAGNLVIDGSVSGQLRKLATELGI
ncbi:MAG: F0F1 ATP synthase subunit delta [Candidatus Polarisedimenticolaceae bacterium]|nr:F0F1 ATP synthase subunit delta [Candidatus Polarisedimenticolaceae bacterium]